MSLTNCETSLLPLFDGWNKIYMSYVLYYFVKLLGNKWLKHNSVTLYLISFLLLSSFYLQTYINHTIYNDLFKYICTAMAAEDAKLNKINRNLSQIQLKDLGIVSEFRYNYKFESKSLT